MNLPLTILLITLAITGLIARDVQKLGSQRDKPPSGWTKLAWPEMKTILFDQFAPTDEERVFMEAAYPKTPTVAPAKKRRLLIFYRCQYPHSSIATGTEAFQRMGQVTGAYEPILSDDPADFTPENLATFDAVLLNNTTDWEKTLGPDRTTALLDFVCSGGGLIGIHAASDACKGHKEAAAMIGGVFRCHPWRPEGNWAFQLESPNHALNAVFDRQGFWARDEVYIYRPGTFTRDRSRVIVSMDMRGGKNLGGPGFLEREREHATNDEHPMVWLHAFGKGRVFYSNFGHAHFTYWDPRILQQFLDGIQYAFGDLKADPTPSAEIPETHRAPAPAEP